MFYDVCPRCGDFVLKFTPCACPPASASGLREMPTAAGAPDAAPRSAAVEVAAGKPEVAALRDRLQLLEQSAALARAALLNSSDIVFQDPSKRHLRADALAQLEKLIGPTTT